MTTLRLLAPAALLLLLAACNDPNQAGVSAPSGGGSAAASGPGYCDAPPSNPDDLDQWQQMCNPTR